MEPIRIRPGGPGRLKVLFPYSPELVDKIRTVPDRWWHEEEKVWSVPHDRQTIPRLMALFSGQRVLLAPILAPRHPAAPCGAASRYWTRSAAPSGHAT